MKSNVIVDLSNIGHNARVITNTFKDYKYYMAVLKGNAYGHGMKVVNKIIENGFNYIAVFSIDEALEIRKYNKDIPILLLCPILIEELDVAKKNNLTITVNDINYLKELVKHDYKLKIHLKLDTGMNRLGFKDKAEVVYAVNAIKESNYSTNNTTPCISELYKDSKLSLSLFHENFSDSGYLFISFSIMSFSDEND